jgi:hypothetical protein
LGFCWCVHRNRVRLDHRSSSPQDRPQDGLGSRVARRVRAAGRMFRPQLSRPRRTTIEHRVSRDVPFRHRTPSGCHTIARKFV